MVGREESGSVVVATHTKRIVRALHPSQLLCWISDFLRPHVYLVLAGGEIPMDEASLGPPFATPEVEKFLLDGTCCAVPCCGLRP